MNKQEFYYALPYPFKVLAATLKGYSFSSWRYGKETENLVHEAFARESWTAEQWKTWEEERLAYILHRAATRIPYYRDHWQERRRKGDRASWEVLGNWPILEKESLRINSARFVAEDCNRDKMHHLVTSGTTGTSVELWWSRKTTFAWYGLFEARWRRWYGLTYHDNWALFGGKMVAAPGRQTPPFWVWNGGMNQLYMSSYHLRPQNSPSYIEAIRKHRIKYLFGYPSSIYALAQDILQCRLDPPEVAIAITCAEPLYDYQRETIAQAFGCPVRETYGMSEMVAAAGECNHGTLHWWPEVGALEVFEGNRPAGPGEIGDMVTTGLFNEDMPLIRFRVGDRGHSPRESHCPCGRSLPVQPGIEGRCDDVVHLPDGTRIGRFSTIFKGDIPFREFQVIQEELGSIRVLSVPTEDYRPGAEAVIEKKLRERLGTEIRINFELVDQIPRTKNGKFRAVISNVSRKTSLHAR